MSDNSFTITDHQTGQSVDLARASATLGPDAIDANGLASTLGCFTYDPGLVSTATCRSAITYIDGEAGVLLYRGYPIDQLASRSTFLEVAYLLIHGELPDRDQLAGLNQEIKQHTMIHEALKNFFNGFHHDAHPMAMMIGVVGSLSAFYHSQLNMDNAEDRYTTAVRLLAKMPTIAAACYRHSIGTPFMYPRNDLGYCDNFLYMMFAQPTQQFYIDPAAAEALNLLFILHADHEQNASTSTVRLASSTGANPFACIAAGIAALWGPSHGGANEAVIGMLEAIGDINRIPEFIARAKDKNDSFRLMGFGHRIYKHYDPRASIIRATCHQLLDKLSCQAPLFELALRLEEIALADEYFIEKRLYPNVDFYSGIIYRALNIPTAMFTVMFAMARTAGWVAHMLEQKTDPNHKLLRPRQLYVGPPERNFVALNQRPIKRS